MWGLFTKALTLASSTVRVSVINTSANFMITAVLGAMIFSESLPGLWFLGAALLVAGSVIIGRREEVETGVSEVPAGSESLLGRDGRDEDSDGSDGPVLELDSVKDDASEREESSDDDGVLR